MPTSIRDASIDATFAQASQRRKVTVNNIQFGKPFDSPEDWRDQWIYFLMIDRFNNPSGPPNHLPFDDAYGGFQGGKLQGVREKLGYIKNLGAGAFGSHRSCRIRSGRLPSITGMGSRTCSTSTLVSVRNKI